MYNIGFQGVFKDQMGKIVPDGTITVYLAATTTLATIYDSTATLVANSAVTSDSNGQFDFFFDPKDYHPLQRFKIILSKEGYDPLTYDYLSIFPNVDGRYLVDYNESDIGVAGDGFSLKDLIDDIGTSEYAKIRLSHNSGGNTTTYNLGTDETLPDNIQLEIENGALIKPASGKRFTVGWPQQVLASPDQHWVDTSGNSTNPIAFTNPGEVHLKWFGAKIDGSTVDTTAWKTAFASFPKRGGDLIHPGGISVVDASLVWPNDGTECYPINIIGKTAALRRTGTYTEYVSGMSVIYFTADDKLFDFTAGGTIDLVFSGSLQGIACYGTWDGAGDGIGSIGIYGCQFQTAQIENCRFVKFEYGIHLTEVNSQSPFWYYGTCRDNVFAHCGDNVFLDVCNVQGTIFQNCMFNRAARWTSGGGVGEGWGLRSSYPGLLHVQGCYFENNDRNGLSVSDPEKVKIDGCYFEGNCVETGTSHAIIAGSAFYDTSLTVTDNKFDWGDKAYDRYCLDLNDVITLRVEGNVFKDYHSSSDQVIVVSGVFPSGVAFGNKLPYASGVTLMPDPAKTGRFLNLDQQYKGIWTHYRFPRYVDNFQMGDVIICDGDETGGNPDPNAFAYRVTEPGAGPSISALSITASIASGAPTLTGMSSQVGLCRGMAVQINDGGSPHTFAGGNDYAIIVEFPSGTTATLSDNASGTLTDEAVTHNAVAYDTIYYDSQEETITAAGAANPFGGTIFDSTGGAMTVTLANGSYTGQTKTAQLDADGGDVTFRVANHFSGTNHDLVFTAVDDRAVLVWLGDKWDTIYSVLT